MYTCMHVCPRPPKGYKGLPNPPQELKDGWVIPTSSSINIEFLFVGSFVSEPLLIVINPSH